MKEPRLTGKFNIPHPMQSMERCVRLASLADERADEVRKGDVETHDALADLFEIQAQLLRAVASAMAPPPQAQRPPGGLVIPGGMKVPRPNGRG